MPKEDLEVVDERPMQKRLEYIRKCKSDAWKRWQAEYVRALRERYNAHNKDPNRRKPKIDEIVLIKGDSKNRNHCNIGIVE